MAKSIFSDEIRNLIHWFNKYNCIPKAIPNCYVKDVLGRRQKHNELLPKVLHVRSNGDVCEAHRNEVGAVIFYSWVR